MPISSLPVPPTRQDPTNFADRADSFLAALPTFAIEANALQTDVNSKQASAAVSATNAQAAATAAQASAGVTLWNAGTTYTQGQTVYSPTSFYTYRRKVAGQTATDPASDATNWVQVTGTGNVNSESDVYLNQNLVVKGAIAELGQGRASDGNSLLDLTSQAGADYNLRLIRSSGVNGNSELIHRGAGTLYLSCQDTGGVAIRTQSIDRYVLSTDGIHSFRLPGSGTPTVDVASSQDNPYILLRRFSGTSSDYFSGTLSLVGGDLVYTTGFTGQSSNERFRVFSTGSITLGTGVTPQGIGINTNLNFIQHSPDVTTVSQFSTENVGNLYISSYKGTGSSISFSTSLSNGSVTEKMRIDTKGNVGIGVTSPTTKLHVDGALSLKIPTYVSAGTYSVTSSDTSIRFTAACTVTLPPAVSFAGRLLNLITVNANAIVAVNTTNGAVVPLTSASGGTSILPATAGKCITLQSDGSNWIAIAGN